MFLPSFSDDQMGITSWLGKPTFKETIGIWIDLTNQSALVGSMFLAIFSIAFIVYKDWKNRVLSLIPFLTILSIFLWSYFFVPFQAERYVLFFIPVLIILAFWLFGKSNFKPLVIIPLLLFFTLDIRGSNEDWRNAVQWIKQYNQDEWIIVTPQYMYRPFFYYYDPLEFRKAGHIVERAYYDHNIYFMNEISSSFIQDQKRSSLWLIESRFNPKNKWNVRILDNSYSTVSRKRFRGIIVSRYSNESGK